MEQMINIHIERLPEGVYLATSDDIQGLIAQGRTAQEAIEIARDVVRRLLESKQEKKTVSGLKPLRKKFDYPLVVGG